jgi:DMSO/TMAO reductase YedYZ molybdopterin-dependent catalytic subunit
MPDMKERIISERTLLFKTTFAFVFFVAAYLTGFYSWKRLRQEVRIDGVQKTLRKGLSTNERIFGSLFSDKRLVKTYPISEAVGHVRVNGKEGLRTPLDTSSWRLQVIKASGDTLSLTLNDIEKLPKTDVVFDFKCIEGWSQKTWWSGVTFSDFAKYYHLTNELNETYAGLVTPDKEYYVGVDMPSMVQPQTLLCYEMNGKPLPLDQGYPLRLIIPVKYGIKHLKRIGTIFFSDQKPPDFWAERGYDYYAGH